MFAQLYGQAIQNLVVTVHIMTLRQTGPQYVSCSWLNTATLGTFCSILNVANVVNLLLLEGCQRQHEEWRKTYQDYIQVIICSKIHNWIPMTLILSICIVQRVYLDVYHNLKIHEPWPTFWTASKDDEPLEEMIAGIVPLTNVLIFWQLHFFKTCAYQQFAIHSTTPTYIILTPMHTTTIHHWVVPLLGWLLLWLDGLCHHWVSYCYD